MARLPLGTPPTPVKDRLKNYRDALERSGGRRLVVDLNSEATNALAFIQEREGGFVRKAVEDALISYAQALRSAPSRSQ